MRQFALLFGFGFMVGLPNGMGQFIPGKPVVIHAAVNSTPERQGSIEGPRKGLGSVAPPERGARGGRSRPPAPIPPSPPAPKISGAAVAVEQTAQGNRPAPPLLTSFDGLGDSSAGGRGGIDLSLAVGPDHIFEILDGNMAVFTKKGTKYDSTGTLLYGPAPNTSVFAGFGVRCSTANNSDSVVRFDQLAGRWLIVVPVFQPPYAMCYAVSATSDPLGTYYRYEFQRPLFPDYPRPAVWPDGYYNPTSTSDNPIPNVVTQKHECIADRNNMLKGLPAAEQCVVIDSAVFLLNSDVVGTRPPPKGTPNIMMSTGGAQLLKVFEDDGIYFYKVHVDWSDPSKTSVSAPQKIGVAPYHYLCDGQLSSCVSQPGTDRRLDSQGDKLIQGLIYRNFGDRESIAASHSIATAAQAGGVRWYEFRLNRRRDPVLYQQGTYAPDGFSRWLGSIGMDRNGDIAIGYSFGGGPNHPGQRFAARLAKDPLGQLSLHELILAEGQASQTNSLRWEDYTNITVDPSDECTFWFAGNYLKAGATSSTTRITAVALPGCVSPPLHR
jgi:hypothetical protein